MLKQDAVIHFYHPISQKRYRLDVKEEGPVLDSPLVLHFAIPAIQWWDDIVKT